MTTGVTSGLTSGAPLDDPSLLLEALSHLPVSLAVYDPHQRLVFQTNPAVLHPELPAEGLPPGTPLREVIAQAAYLGVYGPGDPEARIEAAMQFDRRRPWRHLLRGTMGRVLDCTCQSLPDGGFVHVMVDVSTLAQSEAQSLAAARQVGGVLDRLRVGVAVFGPGRVLKLMNPAYGTLLGAPPGLLRIGMTMEDAYAALNERGEFANIDGEAHSRRRLELDRSQPLSLIREKPDGEVIHTTSRPMPDGGFMVEVTLLTDLKRAEERAQQRAQLLDGIMTVLPHGIAVFSADHRATMVNEAYRQLLGDSAPAIGETLDAMILRGHAAGEYGDTPIAEVRRRTWAWTGSEQTEWVRSRPDGGSIVIRGASLPDGGKVVVVTDITALQQAQETGRLQAERQRVMLDNARSGVTLFDGQGRLIAANALATKLCGFAPGELWPGRDISDIRRAQSLRGEFGREDQAQSFLASRPQVFGAGRYARVRPDGTVLEITTDPTPDGGFVRTFTDVTEDRRVRAELQRAKDSAEAANRAKSRFLTTMTHELRTPLNAVIGFSDALIQAAAAGQVPPPAEAEEYARAINDAGRHLLGLIDDILDVARAEAAVTAAASQPLDLDSVLESVARNARAQAEAAGLTLVLEQLPDPPRVLVDEKRLRQVIENLLANALKFTEPGGRVVLSASMKNDDLEVSVIDTGIGMHPEDIPRAFEPFVQLETSHARRFGGSGLGLHLARTLAHGMGCDIALYSTPGSGTAAVLTIPAVCLTALDLGVSPDV